MREKAVLATSNPKLGHPLLTKTADLAHGLFDDVSRICFL